MSGVKITKEGLVVPIDVADEITKTNLQEVLQRLRAELKEFEKGEWMHPEDVKMNHELIPMLEKLIWYFGG